MKRRVLALVFAIVLTFGMIGMFASCGNYAETNEKIKIGISGPLTGGAAMYGIAVENSAKLAVEEINAKGGLNGILFEVVMLDDKHDANNISTNYAALYEGGMQVSLGTVTTKPGLEFKEYAYADNVFFLTPSATGDDIPSYSNGYQMCFADSDQGTVSAQVFTEKFQGKKIGIFYKSDDDYSVGIKNNFVAALDKSFGTPVEASFSDATATSFKQQVSDLKDCDVIFMPIYYDPAAQFMKDGNGVIKNNAIYYGCDGLDGIDSVKGFDINSIPQGVSYLSHFNSNSTTGAAGAYIAAYRAKYGKDATVNQFGAAAYDCVYAIYEGMKYAVEKNGATITKNIAPSDLCNILTAVFDSKDFKFRGITGAPEADGKSTITWNENGTATNGHVKKNPVSYVVKEATNAQ